jgi:tRNA modification GTPase
LVTRERHRLALNAVVAALDRAAACIEAELLAEELRLAAFELGRLLGRIDVEDVLGDIFSRFCIGK